MYTVQPVILCGGSGTRLWPLSTNDVPKQFVKVGDKTLLEHTIDRVTYLSEGSEYRWLDILFVSHQKYPLKYDNVLYENYANDTAVAIYRTVEYLKNDASNTILLFLPSDHYISKPDRFKADVLEGINKVTHENIVIYGIEPTGLESKYGYILNNNDNSVSFKEKPSLDVAKDLINEGALWNSGMLAVNLSHLKQLLDATNLQDWLINEREGKAPSFDVAVLQEQKGQYQLSVIKCQDWEWSDVGTWDSFLSVPVIKDEILSQEKCKICDCKNVNVLTRTDSNVVVIGCSNINVIVTEDKILVMDNSVDHSGILKSIDFSSQS